MKRVKFTFDQSHLNLVSGNGLVYVSSLMIASNDSDVRQLAR